MIRDQDVREAILQGTFDWRSHTDDEILLTLMETMQHTEETAAANPVSLEVSTSQHIAKYRKMNENKSSSPSGLHRGHDLVHIQDETIAAHTDTDVHPQKNKMMRASKMSPTSC